MRRAAKTDASQSAIVERLREIGAWVRPTHQIGQGFPDLLVYARGRLFLIEVKEPGEKLNKLQAAFLEHCPCEVHVVRTPEEAVLAAIGKEAMI